MKMKKAALIAGILGAVIIGSSITIIDRKNTVFTKGNVVI